MLEDKKIIVLGGAGLIGRSCCCAIDAAGGDVVVADAGLASGDDGLRFDITDEQRVGEVIDDLLADWGRIDGVVNCAYPRTEGLHKPLEEVGYDDFCANLSLHLGGYFVVTRLFAAAMARSGGGVIVNFASIYGVIAPRFDIYAGLDMTTPVVYPPIKAGIIQMSRYFAQYYRKHGVRVNCVSPGGVRDGQPSAFQAAYDSHCGVGGLLEASDLDAAVVYLLSDGARRVTGMNLVVDDGFSL